MSWFATMCCLEPAFPGFSGELWFPGFSGEFWLPGFFWGILGNQILLEKDCVRRSRIETTERRDHVTVTWQPHQEHVDVVCNSFLLQFSNSSNRQLMLWRQDHVILLNSSFFFPFQSAS
jgi:hypothetical protein